MADRICTHLNTMRITRSATAADIPGIQALQTANLYTNLSEADRRAHAFLLELG